MATYNSTDGEATATRVASADDALPDDPAQLKALLRRTQRLASLGTAAAMLAHEFNNAMTPIVGYAKYAVKSGDPELMAKALHTAIQQSETVLGMTQRVLGMASDAPPQREKVNVRHIAEEAVASLCRDLSKDGITLTVDMDASCAVLGDPRQLQQVLFNLLLNAMDALDGKRGRIRIAAQNTTNGMTEITFSDTGCGIDANQLPGIFQPFYTTKSPINGSAKGGSGLGLAICRDIIVYHGGSVRVESSPGAGTTFVISLPSAA